MDPARRERRSAGLRIPRRGASGRDCGAAGGFERREGEQALCEREEIALLEADMPVQQLGELDHHARIGFFVDQLTESAVICARLLHGVSRARGIELGEEERFLDVEVRLEFQREDAPHIFPHLRQRASIPILFHCAPDTPGEHERSVMVIGERLQMRMTLQSFSRPSRPAGGW